MIVYYLDDEASLCEIFSEFIADDKTTVETFTDASQAIHRCKITPPDLIFIDYRLSDTSGDKVAAAVGDKITRILVTGELEVPDSNVFSEVISKPFKFNKIKSIVESFRPQQGCDQTSSTKELR